MIKFVRLVKNKSTFFSLFSVLFISIYRCRMNRKREKIFITTGRWKRYSRFSKMQIRIPRLFRSTSIWWETIIMDLTVKTGSSEAPHEKIYQAIHQHRPSAARRGKNVIIHVKVREHSKDSIHFHGFSNVIFFCFDIFFCCFLFLCYFENYIKIYCSQNI